jgi:hypothetical protein
MLDQNTTTVLTALITVGGTLGGVILGVVLTNRYASTQEKIKRMQPVIEETYTLLITIHKHLSYCIRKDGPQSGLLQEIREPMDRLMVLLSLYLPSLKQQTNDYFKNLLELGTAYSGYYDLWEIDADDEWGLKEEYTKIQQLMETSIKRDKALRQSLENLVK